MRSHTENEMDLSKYPLLQARKETPFVKQMIGAYTEGGKTYVMNVNGSPMARAIWNLILSHRDLKMWCGEQKMKPHRGWKVSEVKEYFGLKGNGENLLTRFEALKGEVDRMEADLLQAFKKFQEA